MTKSRKLKYDLCSELHEDDGIDFKYLFKDKKKVCHPKKSMMLEKHLKESLSMTFLGEIKDERINGLNVESIDASNAGCWLITVSSDELKTMEELDGLYLLLNQVKYLFKQALFSSVRRKRLPDLKFHVLNSRQGESSC